MAHRIICHRQVQRVTRVTLARLAQWDHRGQQVQLEHRVQPVLPAHPELLARQVLKVSKALRACRGQLVRKVHLAHRALLGRVAFRAYPV